ELAEYMLCSAGVEPIGRQRVCARQQHEIFTRDGQVQNALLCADRTVALAEFAQIGADAKSHPPTMASAFIGFLHRLHSSSVLSRGYHRRKGPTTIVTTEERSGAPDKPFPHSGLGDGVCGWQRMAAHRRVRASVNPH